MKRLTAFIMAAGLLLSTLCINVSAAGYGRVPEYDTFAAQGENIYYFEDGAIREFNIASGKKRIICKAESAEDICVSGNSLYYVDYSAESRYYGESVIFKADIGSGKKTEFYKCSHDKWINGIITVGDRIYIQFNEVMSPASIEDYVDIWDMNGNFLKYFTPCKHTVSRFMDTDGYEACVFSSELKEVWTYYGEEDDEPDYCLDYTGAYNIVKIKSDLTEERVTVPAKIGKNIESTSSFVYCDEKYVYFIDKSGRLCRYSSETEKYAVLADGGVRTACFRNGTLYFFTEKGVLKKYEKGKASTVKEFPDPNGEQYGLCFFDGYILYCYNDYSDYCVIGYDGKELRAELP